MINLLGDEWAFLECMTHGDYPIELGVCPTCLAISDEAEDTVSNYE